MLSGEIGTVCTSTLGGEIGQLARRGPELFLDEDSEKRKVPARAAWSKPPRWLPLPPNRGDAACANIHRRTMTPSEPSLRS